MKSASGLTLAQVFGLTLAGLTLLLGGLFYVLLHGWQGSIMDSASKFRDTQIERIGDKVEESLYRAQRSLENLERQIKLGACHADDALSLEASLFAEVLNDPDLSEITLTHAVKLGYDEYLQIRMAREGRWQVSVLREAAGADSPILTRFTFLDGRRFVADVRQRPAGGSLLAAPLTRTGEVAADPTEHPTFQTTTSTRFHGEAVWSDLHFSERDAHLPEAARRIVVTVMKAVEDGHGRFVGVLRVGLLTKEIDELVRRENERKENRPHRIFICDDQGRLITRGDPADRMQEQPDEELRVPSTGLPAELTLALSHPLLGQISPKRIKGSGEFNASGRRHLVDYEGLVKTQGWRVGIVVPEDHYLADLVSARDRLLKASVGVLAVILLGGGLTVRTVRRGLGRIVDSTARMRNFDFAPSDIRSSFRDVQAVMERLELAKTALRAMGKYVPIDLVRLLYQANREPVLGGELVDVSLMFTDIKDFTSLSERLSPNELARVLGRYLEVMTGAIHGAQGTIDKYIGDAIMAVWNVPTPCPGHALRACQAAQACIRAGRALFESPEWGDRPPLHTRFGLHRDEVMVGHFGAPDRMSFTALGDGVNLASRLEGLNKQYGTTVIVSETIQDEAKGAFAFRFLDVVAVKGKTKGIRVYELLGEARDVDLRLEPARRYEGALEAYLRRDFAGALAVLEAQIDDAPSRVLADRCRHMIENPPPEDWDGIYISKTK